MSNTGIELLLGIVPSNFSDGYVVDDDMVDITSFDEATTIIPCFNFDGSNTGLVRKLLSDINRSTILFGNEEKYTLLTLQMASPRISTYPNFYAAIKDGFGCAKGSEQIMANNPILGHLARNYSEPAMFYTTLKHGGLSGLILCSHLAHAPFKCIVGPAYKSEVVGYEELESGYLVRVAFC